MASAIGTMGGTLRHLRDLFHDGTTLGMGDGQLLARFASDGDQAAFEALVARHGPLVLATCRAVLGHEHDVEDAFQATFLVLARQARLVRTGAALGGWLHRVAYRISVQAGAEAQRRRRREVEAAAMARSRPAADGEVVAIVHEEVDRLPDHERLPVVLCDLEGLTYQQAAERLNWTEPTLRHRLVKGRGRLRERLTRRGVTAGTIGVLLASSSARAAVPAALARAAVVAVVDGKVPAAVAALSTGFIRSMTVSSLRMVAAGVVIVAALGSAGVLAVGAGRTDKHGPAMQAAGAAKGLRAAAPVPPRDVKPSAPADGPPIEGRIVDLEGRPVAGARVTVERLWSAPDGDLGRWLDQVRDRGFYPRMGLEPRPAKLAATTGPDGWFRLTGVGPNQIADAFVSGPRIATAQLYLTGRDGADVRVSVVHFRDSRQLVYHARRFEYAAAPGRAIVGVIRDQDTGRPLAGISLQAAVFEQGSLIPDWGIEAKTDAEGHYRLEGLRPAAAYRVFATPGPGMPYPKATLRTSGEARPFEPVTYDFALKRGILLRGTVTEKGTGRPVSGYVNVYAFADNPHTGAFPGYALSYPPHSPVKDGRYEVVALPGRGIIGCRAEPMERYRGSIGAEAIPGYDPRYDGFRTMPHRCNVHDYHVVAELNLDPKAETATLDIQVDPGRLLLIDVVDSDGRPVADTKAAGVGELFNTTEYRQTGSRVEIYALDPSRPRRVTISHAGRKLIGSVYLKGDESGPLTLKLQPWGAIAGRIVDEDGQPRGGMALSSAGGSFPDRPDEQGILPDGNVGEGIRLGRDGRFRVERLIPGLKYGGEAQQGIAIIGTLFRDVVVAPGEVKDLGDLKVIPLKRGN